MKSIVLLVLPLLAHAGGQPGPEVIGEASGTPVPAPSVPAVSVTSYDSPHSSGDSTWTVPTTVSYHVGGNYTSMMDADATSSVKSTITAETEHHTSASSTAPTGAQSAEPYAGSANRAMTGAGMLFFAGLVYFI